MLKKIAIIKELMINNWFVAEKLAQGETKGGAEVCDTYLATLTTRLENSLNAPDYQMPLYIGGRGSGIRDKNNDLKNNPYQNMPVDPTHQSGFYWVTGPEGQGDGTLFYDMRDSKFQASTVDGKKSDTKGKEVYGYTNWSSYENAKKTAIFWQPDNSSPFLTVGYGRTSLWDDAAIDGATTVGFIQEKNLANSSLKINSGTGEVKLQGDIGKSKALDTVSIESNNEVTVGTDNNNVTDYYHGTIYVDHGLYISGNGVKVGGEIHSGESEETDTSTTLEDTYKDNVTILSSGDIEVHGITSNTYNAANKDGTTTTRGGKISLTSTGDSGKITLGAGVDYDGNATAGTIAAGSSDNGAVIIDAQGKTGAFINSTDPKSPAITTAPHGTWQVYVASPSDYGTVLGGNLNSETNAQWSSESTKKSTSDESDKNAAGKDIGTYTDHTQNKFIFQVTPVITISGGNQKKTYGDTLPKDQLRGLLSTSATYKDSTGKDVDVTQFGNFKEADYLTYVTSSDGTKTGTDAVAVFSGGADAKATRTDGNEKHPGTDDYKTASDGNRAFYVFNVEEDGAKALNGYDLNTINGDIEILRKTLTINTDATQTYGKADVTSRTTKDYSTQLVNGDTLDAGDITYTIATKGTYATSKGSNTTAHKGIYENQYLTSGAGVKGSDGSDASANYEVTGSGTITVNPANLYLIVGNVSTTYGTAFDDTQYGYTVDSAKGGLVNGDTQDAVLEADFLSYTNTGAKTDDSNDKVKTQNAGSYELQGAANKNLSDYTVHITNGKSIVKKATLVVDTTGNTRTYGDVSNVASDVANAASFHVSGSADKTVNGDAEADILKELGLSTSSDAQVKDEKGNVIKTGNANTDPGYDIKAAFKKDLTNYTVSEGTVGKEKIEKAALVVDTTGNTRTYGDVSNVASDVANAASFHVSGSADKTVNGDTEADILKELGLSTSSDAQVKDEKGNVIKTGNANTDPGYDIKADFKKDLKNYTVSEGTVGKEKIEKATLHLSTDNYTEAYGDAGAVQKDLGATKVTGEKNGDNLADLVPEIDIHNTSKALLSDTRTNDVKYKADGSLDSYGITTKFNESLDNYDVVLDKAGSVTLTPKDIYTEVNGKGSTLNDLTWTVMKDPKDQMVNGDSVKFTYTPGNLISYDNQTFDVNSFINGTQIYDSTTDVPRYGKNYIFHSKGIVQLTFNPIVKPDVWAHSGGYRPRNKIETSLPVFRVEDRKVGQYGTYGVEHNEEGDKLVLSATGMRLPEPDQVPDEERTFTTTLSTEAGSGTFQLVYNGVSLKVYPQDKEAEETVRAGDKTKNVSLSEKALYVGYTEMGLDLIDLKGVYIYFN